MSYKFGIAVTKRLGSEVYRSIGVCSCGQHTIGATNYQLDFQCEKCGNDYFVDARGRKEGRFVIPYLEASRKDNRGFKVKRTNLSIVYKDGEVKGVKENLTRTMEYDIVDKVLKVWREEELEFDYNEKGMNSTYKRDRANTLFFTSLQSKDFLDFVSTEVTREIYTEIVYGLGSTSYCRKNNIILGLYKFFEEHSHLQILASAGIPKVDRFYRRRYSYDRNDTVLDTAKTKPHEILKVPKFMMEYIRTDVSIDRHVLSNLQSHFKNKDNNKLREIMSIVKDEGTIRDFSNSIDTIMTIHIDYEYTNLKKLILYLFREVRLTQGIESASNSSTYLRDYIRMSRALNLEYEKYPKSLKKVHDVAQMNYKAINQGEEQKRLFKMAVEKKSYKELEFEDKKQDYVILIPEESNDIVREGNELSHCVASYVKDVVNDKCKILFMRKKDDVSKPLATIEVRGMNIRQARGYSNRSITAEQREFLKLWADKKNLVEAYY